MMMKGERNALRLGATVLGIIILNIGGMAFDLWGEAFDRIGGSTGWEAIGYGVASSIAFACFIVVANLTGFAFIYASRHIDAERKKDHPKEDTK
jgi:hypothetical protein